MDTPTPVALIQTPEAEQPSKLSAVIACYRDAPAIPIMYERLVKTFQQIGVHYEIVFVNDCSPDETRAALEELCRRDASVVAINHTRNFGSQASFTSGMKIATGDAVILLDGDLQDPPELIAAFVEQWRAGFDIVYGERVQREANLFLRSAYKAFYRLFRKLAYLNIPLDAGDFSLLDRRAVEALNALPETNRFVRGLRAWVGFRQIGVPYVRPERMFGRTTNSFFKNVGWARKAIFSFSYVPLELITILSLAMVAISFLALTAQIIFRFAYPERVPMGFTTLIVLILFIGGVQLLSLGIIGSYLAHIYDEVKHRPPYIVESIWNDPRAPAPPPPRA
ncbi:MAG: glycosyltransferase family 2 protein [Chthoniobacterales bacterium]